MKTRLLNLWDRLSTSYWFMPSLFALVAMGLAVAVPWIDSRIGNWLREELPWFVLSPSAAHAVLSTIGGGMITVTCVVFSITMLILSNASSQFGPRLLRTFIADRSTQVTLGVFIGTSLYCMIVLASVRDYGDTSYVPNIAVTLGVLLGVIALALLIYFIHSVASSIQAPHVVAAVAHDLDNAVDRLFPDELEQDDTPNGVSDEETARSLGNDHAAFPSPGEGYLQAVNESRLLELAERDDLILRLLHRPGDYVVRETPQVLVWPASRYTDDLEKDLKECFIFGIRRTPRQDLECTINELVEVAVRALSPGINDPSTACTCVDCLSAALSRLAGRREAPVRLTGDDGRLRVILKACTFPGALDAAFNQIRQYGQTSVPVVIRLLEGLEIIGRACRRDRDREAVQNHAEMVRRGAEQEFEEQYDLDDIRERALAVEDAIAASRSKRTV